jgi:hypothetical protein
MTDISSTAVRISVESSGSRGPTRTRLAALVGRWKEHLKSHTVTEEETFAKNKQQLNRKDVVALLNYAVWHADSRGDLAFPMAMEKFHNLGQDEQAKVIRKMEKELCYHSHYSFESAEKARGARMVSDFFAEAVKNLPKDSDGMPVVSPYWRAVEALETLIHDGSIAAPAAARALWNMAYPALRSNLMPGVGGMQGLSNLEYPAPNGYDFWNLLLQDSASRPAAIEELLKAGYDSTRPPATLEDLLNFGQAVDIKKHGWGILRLNISTMGRDIAMSKSENKTRFLLQLVSDGDPYISCAAFWSAIYHDGMPEDFRNAAVSRFSYYSKRISELSMALEESRAATLLLQHTEEPPGLSGTVMEIKGPILLKLRETAARFNALRKELEETRLQQSMVNEFWIITECKRVLEHTDEKRFDAIPQIINIYTHGRRGVARPQLTPMVLDLIREVSEILKGMPAETGSRTVYHERAALMFAELLIATDPSSGNGARGRMLETLSGMLRSDDERRFYAASALFRFGYETAIHSNIEVFKNEGALFMLPIKDNDPAYLCKELTDVARAMVKEVIEPAGTTWSIKSRRPPQDREMALGILNAMLNPMIPVHGMLPGAGFFLDNLSLACLSGIPIEKLVREAELPEKLIRDGAKKAFQPVPEISIHNLQTPRLKRIHLENRPSGRVLPPGTERSKTDDFRQHRPMGDRMRR